MGNDPTGPALSGEELRLIQLLRTRGLSIKNLDDATRSRLREFFVHLHYERGLSLSDIAKIIGSKTSGYTSWVCKSLGIPARPFEEARLKAIRQKRRKYESRPFDGTDEDRAYMLGLRRGDLSVSRPRKGVVRVSTSTTHPAMAELFHSLFDPYGHVYQNPRYKKDTKSYEWNLSAILDDSFEFLFESIGVTFSRLQARERLALSYLSGFLDAEGSIVITRNNSGKVEIFVDYYNSNLILLKRVKRFVVSHGYQSSLRINKREEVRTRKYNIIHRKDYWQLSTYGMKRIRHLVSSLHPRHSEKIRRGDLALSTRKGDDFREVKGKLDDLRRAIRSEVQAFISECERNYLESHPGR